MSADPNPDTVIRDVLRHARNIAVVGFSHNPARPSHYVAKFLAECGYRIVPINPGLAGQSFLGSTVRATLSEVEEPVDMIDIFRRSEHIPGVVDEAMRALPGLKYVWMQLGLKSAAAAKAAEDAGCLVVQDRCPKIEIPRLFASGWTVGD